MSHTIQLRQRTFDHVVGVNCSHADLAYLTAIVDAVGDRVEVHVGGPLQALAALALGANGFLERCLTPSSAVNAPCTTSPGVSATEPESL